MLSLFSKSVKASYPIRRTQSYINLLKVFNFNRLVFRDYYNNYEGKVNNSNLLVRIINIINFDGINTMLELLPVIEYYHPTIVKNFRIISRLSQGDAKTKLLDMILVPDLFKMDDSNFERFNVLKVLYSESLVDGLALKHLRHNEFEDILGIDVKALIASYFYWRRERSLNNLSIDPAIYVYQIAYTNLAIDKVSFSLYNVFINKLVYDIDIPKDIKNPNPIDLKPYINYMNDYVNNLSKDIKRSSKQLRMEEILSMIQLPVYGNALKLLERDFGYVNMNNRSHIYLIELPELFTLLDITGLSVAKSKNRNLGIDLNQAKRDFFGQNIKFNQYFFKEAKKIISPIIKKF